ncbi:MAG: ABC transporter ATP-binding protein [Spirochaetes bacterium]|nr:ABC transporter ATP-binding protein [Spirochaetota bacterium]
MILKLQDVTFSYKSDTVLDDVTFEVHDGELVAVLGPNGVGKTTLLRCINAILKPQRGSVLIDGEDLRHLHGKEVAKRIGYVAQKGESSRLTAFDAILLGRKPHIRWNVSKHDLEIVDAVIKRLGLEHLMLRYIDEMSGGEFQKVCIARALVQEPKILLLDEPTASLDLKNQLDILGFVKHVVSGHGITGLMAVHDLNTALRYSDRFLFMKSGKILSYGTINDVTPGMIEEVYGVKVMLEECKGHPVVIPVE